MIDVQLQGRLANQLFQYALVRTVAERNGYEFHIPRETWLGGDLLKCSLGVEESTPTNWFHDRENQPFQPEAFNVPDFTQFIGFFQTEKYFEREKVKEWFRFDMTDGAKDFIGHYPAGEYCYMNIRGTDQAEFPHLILPKTYYTNAMSIMKRFNPDLRFLIITDDISLSKTYFPNVPIYSNDRDTDFCILNAGRFVVSAISTFCWWACYLNDYNIVIAPRGWFASQLNDNGWSPHDIRTHKFIWI